MTTTEPLPTCHELSPRFRVERGFGDDDHLIIHVPHVLVHSEHVGLTRFRTAGPARRRPRRRLKRKVRVTGQVLAGFAFLAVGWYQGANSRADRPAERPLAATAILPTPAPLVRLSVEVIGAPAELDSVEKVSLPGYLLPDDTREEPIHEGG